MRNKSCGGWQSPVALIGDKWQGGTYVLRILVRRSVLMAFGRFDGGKQIEVSAGEHVYVGSALGLKGPSSLARRLVRHASLTGRRHPHWIRSLMQDRFAAIGLGNGDLAEYHPLARAAAE